MATSNRGDRVRFRYGLCLNDNCSKCKSKEVQEIPARKELVCEECGKPLRECPPPKQGMNMKLIGGIAAAVVVLGGGAFFAFSGGSEESEAAPAADTVQVDSVKAAEPQPAPEANAEKKAPEKAEKPAEKAEKKAAPENNGGGGGNSKTLSYGKYVGSMKGGQPDGVGRLTFTKSYRLNDEYTAEPGEYIDGMFQNGKPVMVTYFKKDGTVVRIKVN